MSESFYHGLRFSLPISLILWALFVWLMLSIFNPVIEVTI